MCLLCIRHAKDFSVRYSGELFLNLRMLCWKYWSIACCLVESLFDSPSLDSFHDSFLTLSMTLSEYRLQSLL
jgi:hypothetical protein